EALALYEQLLPRRKAVLGSRHPDTLLTMNNLAVALKASGQVDKALPLYQEVLAAQRAKPGADHPDTINTMNNLARALAACERPADALPLFEEALTRATARLSPDHRLTRTIKGGQALARTLQHRAALHEKQRQARGPGDPATLRARERLAWVLRTLGGFAA